MCIKKPATIPYIIFNRKFSSFDDEINTTPHTRENKKSDNKIAISE